MVGPVRFELTTSCTPCKRATRLRYGPNKRNGEQAPPPRLRQVLFSFVTKVGFHGLKMAGPVRLARTMRRVGRELAPAVRAPASWRPTRRHFSVSQLSRYSGSDCVVAAKPDQFIGSTVHISVYLCPSVAQLHESGLGDCEREQVDGVGPDLGPCLDDLYGNAALSGVTRRHQGDALHGFHSLTLAAT